MERKVGYKWNKHFKMRSELILRMSNGVYIWIYTFFCFISYLHLTYKMYISWPGSLESDLKPPISNPLVKKIQMWSFQCTYLAENSLKLEAVPQNWSLICQREMICAKTTQPLWRQHNGWARTQDASCKTTEVATDTKAASFSFSL